MENIRNFSIIAHIDHGKSTLADRFLELTETIPKSKMRPQFLDAMDLERERGITIKMQPVKMAYVLDSSAKGGSPPKADAPREHASGGKSYILNLIDTPGHVDFNYEVSRSLAAVEGTVLLVDAAKGIQAQTLANLELARKQNLKIIPAINKIDLANAQIEETLKELSELLGINREEVLKISAKEGTGVKELLATIIKKIPAPKGDVEKPLKALIFDSKYDDYKGVLAFVRLIDGQVKAGEEIYLMASKTKTKIKEVGYFKPGLFSCDKLSAGEIGYIATGIKEPHKVRVGDTITKLKVKSALVRPADGFRKKLKIVEPLSGYQEPKPMVFASIYPENSDDYDLLKKSLEQLKLNDAALIFEGEAKESLGRGFRCGFLGTLHAEIVSERLHREFSLELVISTPSIIYKIIDKKGKENFIYSAKDWPETSQIGEMQEPWVSLEVITPNRYLGSALKLLENLKGNPVETRYFSPERVFLIYEVPLREIIIGFYEKLKGASQGYASMNYSVLGYRPADLVKVEILISGLKEEALSRIVPKDSAYREGRKILEKLKDVLPSQQFALALQATVGARIIARENVSARRKDVIAPLYGGDYTRKKKLLERQKKGKEELKEKRQLQIPSNVFIEMFKE